MSVLKNIHTDSRTAQAAMLYGATLFGVLIGVGVSVMNTRYLDPESYGDVRFIGNIMIFLAGILMLGYFTSASRLMAVAKDEVESAQIKGAAVCLLGIMSLVVMLVMLLCGIIFQYVLVRPYAWLFYCTIPVSISPLILNYINTTSQGDNSIGMIAAARVVPSFFYLIIGYCVFSLFGASSLKMILLQNGIATVSLLILVFLNKPDFRNLKHSLALLKEENSRYGIHVYYGSLSNVGIPYIAGITLGLFALDNTLVGFYTLALTISSPLSLAPSAIGTTYFKQFATETVIPNRVLVTTLIISALSLIAFIILIFPVVSILFDASYSSVALYSSVLAIGSTAQGTGDVFNRFLGAHAQGIQLRNGAWLSGGVSLVGYTAGVWLWGIYGAIVTRVIGSLIYLIAMYVYYKRFINNTTVAS